MNQQDTVSPSKLESEKKALREIGYGENAIHYYLEKPYMGEIPDADHVSEMIGTCGDTMKIYLKIDNGTISDVRYQVLGCPGAVSSAMAIGDIIRRKTLDDARKIHDGNVFGRLEKIPEKKHHCIQLAVKTMHKAIDEYKSGQTYETSQPLACQEACSSECCSKKDNIIN